MDWKDRHKMDYLANTLLRNSIIAHSASVEEKRREEKRQQKEAERRRKAEEERRQQREDLLQQCRTMIEDNVTHLTQLLSELSTSCRLAFDPADLRAMEELMPLFPMAEVLSLQGEIGPEQQAFLRDYLNRHQPRYNLAQFTRAAIDREGVYDQWNALAGLSPTHCGQIWHTVIELVYRRWSPDVMQEIVDCISGILVPFWCMEFPSTDDEEILFGNIVDNLNSHSDSDQDQPHLHAVLLLQYELSQAYGGERPDYIPCLVREATCSVPGESVLQYTVHRTTPLDGVSFPRTYLVREIAAPGPDKIWELSPDHQPTVFFSEEE